MLDFDELNQTNQTSVLKNKRFTLTAWTLLVQPKVEHPALFGHSAITKHPREHASIHRKDS